MREYFSKKREAIYNIVDMIFLKIVSRKVLSPDLSRIFYSKALEHSHLLLGYHYLLVQLAMGYICLDSLDTVMVDAYKIFRASRIGNCMRITIMATSTPASKSMFHAAPTPDHIRKDLLMNVFINENRPCL